MRSVETLSLPALRAVGVAHRELDKHYLANWRCGRSLMERKVLAWRSTTVQQYQRRDSGQEGQSLLHSRFEPDYGTTGEFQMGTFAHERKKVLNGTTRRP